MAGRIYVVKPRKADPATRRLVRAPNSSQAFRHVAEDTIEVALASQADLVELVGAGVKVEDAGAADEAPNN